MSRETEVRTELEAAIDTIEGGYEFMLAYAAQGRRTDRDAVAAQRPRERLRAMADALAALPALATTVADLQDGDLRGHSAAFFDALERDAAIAAAAVRLVLAQSDIGSQLVDNLNASIHLRAVLTDIFLIDEAFKPRR
jgi:hypothetical protein